MNPLLLSLALALAFGGGGRAPEAPLAGHYRLVGEQDVASSLVLEADGQFAYFLAAGALDETARGRWNVEGQKVVLINEPRPVPPAFGQGPSSTTAAAPLEVVVRWPDGRGIAGVDLKIGFDEGEPVVDYTQEDGWRLPAGERRAPRWIELAVPMHGLVSARIPIDLAAGNALAFVLTPNDLGILDLSDLTVEAAEGALIVHRGEGRLRYERIADAAAQ